MAGGLCLFLGYSSLGERGFLRLHRMVNQRDEMRSRVHSLEDSNASLSEEIELLRDDMDTLEELARTQLGMVREGETVFIFSHPSEALSP